MRYTYTDFNKQFPDEDTCLDIAFEKRYGDVKECPKCHRETTFYRVQGRKCYACQFCGYQLHPLAETIFHKSSTPLRSWLYAIYLFSVSKNGISAKELERHLGVTYKTAFRMATQIRKLMEQGDDPLSGTVEVDEAYIGKRPTTPGLDRYQAPTVIGAVERGGRAKAQVVRLNAKETMPFLADNVQSGAKLYTDGAPLYKSPVVKQDFDHEFVNHTRKEWSRNGVHINTIEGFWSYVKRSISGTFVGVSPKYLQSYLNSFVYLYNYRDEAVYPVLLERALKPGQAAC